MQIEQQLPFGFSDDIFLDLEYVRDFDHMIYNPRGYALEEMKRPQLNVSNQNRSTSRIVKPPITKGNPAAWSMFNILIVSLVNHYRSQVGSYKRTNLSDPHAHLAYAELTIDKRSKNIDWVTMFTVTTEQAPMKPMELDLSGQVEKMVPNSKSKPWVEGQPWQQVDNGAFIPPPVKSVAYAMKTELTERFCDTAVFYLHYTLSRSGYHIIDQDKSLIMIYGPSTEYRKIGVRLCHIDDEFKEIFEGVSKLRKELNAIALPGLSKAMGPADTKLIKNQFMSIFKPDPLNEEMYGKFQFHSCPGNLNKEILSQLWSESFSQRIRKATQDLKKNSSSAVFKLFINSLKALKENSDNFEDFTMALVPDAARCTKCRLHTLYTYFIENLILLSQNININTLKDIFGEDYLTRIIREFVPSVQKQLTIDVNVDEFIRQKKRRDVALESYRFRALMLSSSIKTMMDTDIFQSFSEARKASILKSIYNPSGTPEFEWSYLKHTIDDVTSMLTKVAAHQHSERGVGEIKKRDIRSLKSLHDELSYIVQILDTIPKEIKNHQYDFLHGNLKVPYTDFVIKIPTSNIDIKTWGTNQRHCIGSYSDYALQESRSVVGIWDTKKKDWLGHMSFMPIMTPKAGPNGEGKLSFKFVANTSLSVHQFYGRGNVTIEPESKKAVEQHMSSVLSEWLFKVVRWSPEEEEIIESIDRLSLMRTERRLFSEVRLADGEVVLKPSPTRNLAFSDFANKVADAITKHKFSIGNKKLKAPDRREARVQRMFEANRIGRRDDIGGHYEYDVIRDEYRYNAGDYIR